MPLSANAQESDIHSTINASSRAMIDLFVIIDVSATVTRDKPDLVQQIIISLLDEGNFEPEDRICIVLVAGGAYSCCPLIELNAQNLGNTLTAEEDNLIERFQKIGFGDLVDTNLTDLKEGFNQVKNEYQQPTSQIRNRAILLISDGNNDTPPSQESGEHIQEIEQQKIEDKQNLEEAIDAILNADRNIAFFMFHLSHLYKSFWKDEARQYGTTTYSGLYRQILDKNEVSQVVIQMFGILRQSHRIIITSKISEDSEIDPNSMINLMKINVQCDSTLGENVLVTYNVEEKKEDKKFNLILPKPARLLIARNCKSSQTILIGFKGYAERGTRHVFHIEFNPEREYGHVDNLLFQQDDIVIDYGESAITFYPIKGPIIFWPKIFSEDKTVKVIFKSTIASDANPIKVSFGSSGDLPEITEPSEESFVLKRNLQPVRFIFNRKEFESGVYKGNLNFHSPQGYPIAERGKKEDSKNSLSLHFYIPSGWYYIFQGLWGLSILGLITMLILYVYYSLIRQSSYGFEVGYSGQRELFRKTATIGNKRGNISLQLQEMDPNNFTLQDMPPFNLLSLKKKSDGIFIERGKGTKARKVKVEIKSTDKPDKQGDELRPGEQRKIKEGDEIVIDNYHLTASSVSFEDAPRKNCVTKFFDGAIKFKDYRIPHYVYSVVIMFLTLIVTSLVWRNLLPRSWDALSIVFLSVIGLTIIIAIYYVISSKTPEWKTPEDKMFYFHLIVVVLSVLEKLIERIT